MSSTAGETVSATPVAESDGLLFTDVSLGYRTKGLGVSWRYVLGDIRFSVAPGQAVVILGPNGSGKSTILRGATGLIKPIQGRILLGGASLARQRVAYMPQETSVFFWRRAIDDAGSLLQVAGVARKERHAVTSEILKHLRFDPDVRTRNYRLSGGQKQKVALARCLTAARHVSLLAIDEPTNFLDTESRAVLLAELPGFLKDLNCPALIATHDRGLVEALDCTKLEIANGRIAEY